MSTCENCGTSFDPKAAPAEITTTRVLCPTCAAQRAAEKARAKAKAGVAASAPAPSPKPMATAPAPAKVPAVVPPPRASASAPAAKPVTKAAPAPAPARASASSPAKKKEAAAPPRARREHELDKEQLAKSKNRAIIVGYAIAIVLMAVAGVVVWQVRGKHQHDADVEAAEKKKIDDFLTAFNAMDLDTEEHALAAAKFAEDNRAIWEKNDEHSGEVTLRLAKANSNAKLYKERRELMAQIAGYEKDFGSPATLTPERVVDVRRSLEDIEPRISSSPELVVRVSALRSSADQLYAERLLADARASATAGPTRETLNKFQRADDEVRSLLEKAKKAKSQAQIEIFEPLYKTVIKESDEAVGKVFTPEEIEKAPWRDLLADKERENWLAPAAKGFEWRLESGALHVIGPDADSEGTPILSIGDEEKWCDFVGEMEFTLVKGEANLYFRLGIGSNARDVAIAPQKLSTQGENPLVAGESNKATFSIVGSSYLFAISNYEPDTTPIGWTRVRKGALAFEFDPKIKTELRITKLRVKVLRAGGGV